MRARVFLARSVRFFWISQRGLSGTAREERKKMTEGSVTAVNIQRQAYWPFHERRMASAVASGDIFCAMSQLTTCAARMPMTMVNWLSETRRPRHGAGLTSAMYMGAMLEAMPMAMPPTMRQATNAVKEYAHPVSREETAKSTAARMSSFLRPKRSLMAPETMEPIKQPTRAQLMAQPMSSSLVSWK